MKKILLAIIFLVVAFIIVFNFVGTSSDELTNAADSITDANNCSEGKDDTGGTLQFNITDKYCYNSTAGGGGKLYVAGQYDLPLNTLFSSSGVVLLVLMAGILIFMVILALKFAKKQ